ncbi:excinuclease ABC subunit C [Amycolatopsis orientalis]|uniref:Excinuclease ABC subunit C n=1 Tax=Amycolatopsis orientalis TaxID=31958 RepID=A0A193CCY0_AMYOR|nr:excinuclease ABC subunit C [Amycolatopsis orientalis]
MVAATGLELGDIVLLRHTYTDDGLQSPTDLTTAPLLTYTRKQGINNKLGRTPPPVWLIFMADGGRRSRFLTAYENYGELPTERTETHRFFDLRPSDVLASLRERLVVEWSKDTVNWAKTGALGSRLPVVEIADPARVDFPGYDHVLITYAELQAVVEESRYRDWHTALGAVQGIYLIADTSTGQLYVGKADGGERILGRWTAYAKNGHGGNVALRDLTGPDPTHARHFQFSILRVFGPSTPTAEVDAAEAHFKAALLTRKHGLNRN